ncbi:hypothetical protein IHQ56_02705 [Methylobacillus flagellatus]|uniref:hypothetical protein n=1 Tax=Methylobacillus flagellatus TaxID=405 RepID=UPI00285403BA|nr:hypothetical protein [Methylobacillus flagellatus]MDR5170720.1 hypothetical protein [Methylobacillus flagellatus]
MTSIPACIVAGDTAQWVETAFHHAGAYISSADYALVIELRGPGAPITLTGTAYEDSWAVTLDETESAKLVAGTYAWSKRVTASGVRLTVGMGQLQVQPDFASIGAGHDGRTLAERALAEAEAALAQFNSSGGKVRRYSIASRSMEFEAAADILKIIAYWRQRVNAEKGISSDRFARFTRA